MEELELSYFADGNVKWYNHFEKQNDSPLPGADPREMKAGVQAKTYKNVHSSFIYKTQNLETTQMSINSWIHKAIAVSPHNRILFSNKKESTINTHSMDRSQNNYAEWKKRGKKEYTVHVPFI